MDFTTFSGLIVQEGITFLGGSFIDTKLEIFVLFVLNSIVPFLYSEKKPSQVQGEFCKVIEG